MSKDSTNSKETNSWLGSVTEAISGLTSTTETVVNEKVKEAPNSNDKKNDKKRVKKTTLEKKAEIEEDILKIDREILAAQTKEGRNMREKLMFNQHDQKPAHLKQKGGTQKWQGTQLNNSPRNQ